MILFERNLNIEKINPVAKKKENKKFYDIDDLNVDDDSIYLSGDEYREA